MKSFPQTLAGRILLKPTLTMLIACLLLALYIGFLLTANFKARTALREANLQRLQLDLEKRAAAIGYFFSERKNDLQAISTSREIASFFINRSLGMSETYGLKANIFVVRELLKKTRERKKIRGTPIYKRLLFADATGRILADTNGREETSLNADPGTKETDWMKWPRAEESGPLVSVFREESGFRVLTAAACLFQEQVAGLLITELTTDALIHHFIQDSNDPSHIAYFLLDHQRQWLQARDGETMDSPSPLEFATPKRTPDSWMDWRASGMGMVASEDRFLAVAPIESAPLYLLARVDRRAIEDPLSPLKLFWGTGFLALVILIGLIILLRFNGRRLVLQTRIAEFERQKALLAKKNRQMKREIALRKQAEQELENQRTLQMRSDRLRSLGEMAAGIAHELNQPLVGIRGMAEMLQMAMDAGGALPPEKTARRISIILAQVDRMVHIIDHVRRFARESGRPETREVDLNEVVRSGVSLLESQFQCRGISLALNLSEIPLPVQVNPFSIEEVILNFLSNARDAIEVRRDGEALRDYAPRVRISTWNDVEGDRICLSFQDNGTGISQNVALRIFDPFFTTKPPDKGTGLGLSICKSIVEEFGGHIEVSGEEGEGAAFLISFPRISMEEIQKRETA